MKFEDVFQVVRSFTNDSRVGEYLNGMETTPPYEFGDLEFKKSIEMTGGFPNALL